ISTWSLVTDGAQQRNLVITYQHLNHAYMQEKEPEPIITVDNIEVAQFIYLLINNKKLRNIIDTISSKVVLILGRFSPARKVVLDAIRDELRLRNYVPVMFDFDKPTQRDTVETVSTLAHIARLVIADLTEAKSVLQELQRIVPSLPSVPV